MKQVEYGNAAYHKHTLQDASTKYIIHLREPLSTSLARRVVAAPIVSTHNTLHPVTAIRATAIRRNGRVWGVVVVPCAIGVGAPQRPPLLSLQFESLLEPELERVSAVGKRSVEDMTDVFFHEGYRAGVSRV